MRLVLPLGTLVFLFALLVASPAFGEAASGYATWTVAPPNDVALHTPHKDYRTTTVKCAVCHSVHKGEAGGELLLRSSAAESCTFCHITTDIGVTRIYNGVEANYTTEDNRGHQSPAVTCVDCHAVHGANTFGGEKSAKILKVFDIQQSVIDELASGDTTLVINATGDYTTEPKFPANWEARQIQDTAFCSQCHPYYTSKSETSITDSVIQSDGSFAVMTFRAHPLKPPGGEDGSPLYTGFVAQGSTLATSASVAQTSSRGCNWNCHMYAQGATGPGLLPNSYPHYMVDTVRFLSAFETGNASPEEPVSDSREDGVCLHCHRWVDYSGSDPATMGVGLTY